MKKFDCGFERVKFEDLKTGIYLYDCEDDMVYVVSKVMKNKIELSSQGSIWEMKKDYYEENFWRFNEARIME